MQPREVASAVAYHRRAGARYRREDEFADLSVRQRLERLGVDDLRIEVVFPDVQAGPVLAVAGDARAGDLREAVDVVGDDARLAFDRVAHLGCPRLGAEDAVPELGVAPEVDALALGLVHDAKEVARRAGDGVDAQIAHQHDLALSVASACRQHRAAHSFAAVVQTEAAREESVAVADLQHVAGADAVHREAAHRAVLPHGHVAERVGDADRLARRSARAVETHYLVHRCAAKPHRVFVAQIDLLGEGQQLDVGERLYVLGPYATLVAALAEQRHTLVGVFDRPLETVQLECAKLLDRHVVHGRYRVRRRVYILWDDGIERV